MENADIADKTHMLAYEQTISERDFSRLIRLIYDEVGIRLTSDKKTMLEARIRRRLRTLELKSYKEYCDFVFSSQCTHEEMVSLIDVVTTNKTDFFREPKHFEYLVSRAVSELTQNGKDTKPLLIWSAGCSSGEEPYTLSMVLSDYAEKHQGFRFRILATDISTVVLEKAHKGIYNTEIVAPVPTSMKQKYLLRSRDRTTDKVRIVPELRKLIEFKRLNFMDAHYDVCDKADAIFCRNVIIYFDRETQARVLGKLISHLVPGGYLFVGHSETLHDMNLPVVPVAPALYRRLDGAC